MIDRKNSNQIFSEEQKQPKSIFQKIRLIGRAKKKNSKNPQKEKKSDLKDERFLIFRNYRILNLTGNRINFQEIFDCLYKKRRKKKCNCVPSTDFTLPKNFNFFSRSVCFKCDFAPNRKLLLTLFTKTALSINTARDELMMKALTDCSLFVGGFTGKKNSAFFLLGSTGENDLYQRFGVKKVLRRNKENDTMGFEEISEEFEGNEGVSASSASSNGSIGRSSKHEYSFSKFNDGSGSDLGSGDEPSLDFQGDWKKSPNDRGLEEKNSRRFRNSGGGENILESQIVDLDLELSGLGIKFTNLGQNKKKFCGKVDEKTNTAKQIQHSKNSKKDLGKRNLGGEKKNRKHSFIELYCESGNSHPFTSINSKNLGVQSRTRKVSDSESFFVDSGVNEDTLKVIFDQKHGKKIKSNFQT